MVKRTNEQWLTLFQQHQESNLSANQFCKDKKLCAKYFSVRKKQLGWQSATRDAFVKATKTVKVATPHKAPECVLTYGQCHLTLPLSVNEHWLANLVKALNA